MKTQINKEALRLVMATVGEMAVVQRKRMTSSEAQKIARVALLPPVWCKDADRWLDVCVRGLHKDYAGATMHYRASEMKWQDELSELTRDNGVAIAA